MPDDSEHLLNVTLRAGFTIRALPARHSTQFYTHYTVLTGSLAVFFLPAFRPRLHHFPILYGSG